MKDLNVQKLISRVSFTFTKEGQSSTELNCSEPTAIAVTITTDCQHLQHEVICLHCSSHPLALVAMFVNRTTQPCLIIIISQCCWESSCNSFTHTVRKKIKAAQFKQSVGFHSSSRGKGCIEAKTQWIYS